MNKAIIYYKKKNNNILGYGFNQINKIKISNLEKIKNLKIIKLIGLYSDQPGVILNSGWQTKIINLRKNIFTDWMHSAALIIPTEKLKSKFDETFGMYSYLEDLDFSMQMKNKNKKGKFLVVSSAIFYHPNIIERNSFAFGKLEFVNRYKIVKKHNLKYINFFYMVFFKSFLSFLMIPFNLKNYYKFLGNLFGILICLKFYLNSERKWKNY